MNKYEVRWLLDRIKRLEERTHPSWLPTHRNIWQGSYDVISCLQDEIDQIEIPKRRMKEAEKYGFIKSDIVKQGKWEFTVWSLTEKGETFLKEYNQEEKEHLDFIDKHAKDMKARHAWWILAEKGLPIPACGTGPDDKLMYSWDKDEHHLELEFIPNQPAEFFYRNRITKETHDIDWIVGEPLDETIIQKIEIMK